MNVVCDACNTQYQIDESKVPTTGGFIRCKTCGDRVRIPAPGTAPKAAAIPLEGSADDDAPTAVGGSPPPSKPAKAIPLAGGTSDAETPISAPPSGATGSAIPLAGADPDLDEDVHTQVDETPAPVPVGAIPLGGSKDGDATAGSAPTAPGAIALGGTGAEDDAPTAVSSTPQFLDDLPGTVPDSAPASPYDDLPALDNLPPAPPSEASPVARPGIDDLPGPSTGSVHEAETAVKEVDMAMFDDLPGIDDAAASDEPDFPDTVPVIDDLPEIASLDVADDSTSMPAEAPAFDDLPVVDADAPRLMDDLQEGDTTQTAAPESDGSESGAIPALDPLKRTPGKAVTLSRPPEPEPSNKKTFIIAGAIGVALLTLASVTFLTPVFGLQVFGGEEIVVKPITPPPVDPTKPPDEKPPDEKPPDETAVPKPSDVVLADHNVDILTYAELKTATDTHAAAIKADDADGQALLAWARYRLAATFGDEDAGKLLTAKLPKAKELTKLSGLAAASGVAALAYAGKTGPARKIGERMLKTKEKNSPQLALAVASTYSRRPEAQKAIRAFDRVLKIAPNMGDAKFARARWQLDGRNPDEGVLSLSQLIVSTKDPDLTIRAAELLLNAGEFEALDKALENVNQVDTADQVAPARRGAFLEFLAHRRVRAGDLAGAIEAATIRAKAAPMDVVATIELARLTAATGGDAAAVLNGALERITNALDKGHIVAEQVRQALVRGKPEEADTALETGSKAVKGKEAAPWLKMAAGLIAQHKKDLAAARVAFNAAGRGKAKLIEPKVALVLLAEDKPGPTMKKLTELTKKHGLPLAMYHLSRLMKERGNLGGAAKLLDEVLWLDPTVIDSVELLLEWADLLDQTGKSDRAQAVATALHKSRKKDERPVFQLIAMAKRGKRTKEVLDWHRAMVKARPKNSDAKIALARALVDVGEPKEAQLLLNNLFKENPKARTPPAIIVLASSWAYREPYKAKELIREALDKEPLATSHMLMGDVEAGNTKYDKAKVAYNKALEIDPKLTRARIRLGAIHMEERNFEEAVTALRKVTARHPGNREAAELLGDAYLEINKPREALASFQNALAVADDDPALLMKIARVQMQRLNQLPPAVRTLRRAIKAEPKFADAHYYLGLVLKDTGNNGNARQELQTYVRLSPDGEFANDARRIVTDLEKR